MALLGNIETDFNVVGNYHIISSFVWAKFGNIAISVATFKDKESRDSNAKPLLLRTVYIDNVPVNNEPTLMNLYSSLKLISEFNNMTDI